jgi:hypothetical protein
LEELIHEGENDYILPEDSPAGVWIKVDNLTVWIRRDNRAPGVVIEVARARDIEYTLDTLYVQEVE